MTLELPRTAHEALAALRARTLGAGELVEAAIARIGVDSTLGPIELLDEDGAREQARGADALLASGQAGPLTGLPVLVKDVIDVRGLPTRGGTARWRRLPERDADCVAALRAAGAIVIGKGHTNELAFGIDGRNPHRPPCRNPHDLSMLPGGSSSGPAVALAAGFVLGALGTDTSGSIRVPAALCGIVGLRPTHGRLSLRGVLPLAPSYDVVGPLGPCVEDVRLLFTALVAHMGSRQDVHREGTDGEAGTDRGEAIYRVTLIENLLDPAVCEPDVAAAVHGAAEALERLGVAVNAVMIPELDDALAVHRGAQLPEALASVLALGVPEHELGEEVRERLRDAREIGPERHARALRERAGIARALERALAPAGALLAPGSPVPAPPREAEQCRLRSGRVRSQRDTLLSCTVPLTQWPGPVLSVPLARVGRLPVGAQLLTRPGCDERLLELGVRLEGQLGAGTRAESVL
jgi:Asp-tRNA(Asn)/Glu-tRNA(Gln) amidotransferase A subunit family amidase